jgi:hypothetical protein
MTVSSRQTWCGPLASRTGSTLTTLAYFTVSPLLAVAVADDNAVAPCVVPESATRLQLATAAAKVAVIMMWAALIANRLMIVFLVR